MKQTLLCLLFLSGSILNSNAMRDLFSRRDRGETIVREREEKKVSRHFLPPIEGVDRKKTTLKEDSPTKEPDTQVLLPAPCMQSEGSSKEPDTQVLLPAIMSRTNQECWASREYCEGTMMQLLCCLQAMSERMDAMLLELQSKILESSARDREYLVHAMNSLTPEQRKEAMLTHKKKREYGEQLRMRYKNRRDIAEESLHAEFEKMKGMLHRYR